MTFFEFILYLGIIEVLYYLFSSVLGFIVALVFVAIRADKFGAHFLKALNIYFFISLIGILTLAAVNGSTSLIYNLILIAIGLFFAFTTIGGGAYENQKEALREQNYAALEMMKYDNYFIYGSLAFYLVVLFIPSLATTLPVRYLFSGINWVYGLPIIGFFVSGFGILIMLNFLFQGLVMGGAGFYFLFSKLAGHKDKDVEQPSDLNNSSELLAVDPLMVNAVDIMVEYDMVSSSLFQRRLSISFSRAENIKNTLIKQGLIESTDGQKPNKVIKKTKEELDIARDLFAALPKYEAKIYEEEIEEEHDLNSRDSIYEDVKKFISNKKEISVAELQKKFDIGYSRGARIMDHLEEDGMVDAPIGNQPRKVLIAWQTSNSEINVQAQKIVEVLRSFGLETRVEEVNKGKNAIEFVLDVALGYPLEQIVEREREIALVLASPTGKVKIEAPIPGRSFVGITLPLKK